MADTAPDPSMGPEQHHIEDESARTLRKLVAELSPHQRTLLRELFTDNPRSYAEIARVAGIPPGAIVPTRKRALRKLRLLMETRDVMHPDETWRTGDDDRRQQRLVAYALATA